MCLSWLRSDSSEFTHSSLSQLAHYFPKLLGFYVFCFFSICASLLRCFVQSDFGVCSALYELVHNVSELSKWKYLLGQGSHFAEFVHGFQKRKLQSKLFSSSQFAFSSHFLSQPPSVPASSPSASKPLPSTSSPPFNFLCVDTLTLLLVC